MVIKLLYSHKLSKPGGAVLAPGIVVAVHGGELGPLLGQTLPELPVDAPVDDPEPVKRV